MPKIRAKKDAYRWTPKAREFIKQYRLYGAGIRLDLFCKTHGFSYHTYKRWRKGIHGFAAEVDSVREWHAMQGDRLFSTEKEAEALLESGLTRKQSMFLAHYRETYDRVDALKLVRWKVSEYEKELTEYQEFRDQVRLVDHEAGMKVEDALRNSAINGSMAAARKYLESKKPEEYTRKGGTSQPARAQPTAEGTKKSQQLWGERFGVPAVAGGERVSDVAAVAGDEIVEAEVEA